MIWLCSLGQFRGAKPLRICTTLTKAGNSFTSSKPQGLRITENSETDHGCVAEVSTQKLLNNLENQQ